MHSFDTLRARLALALLVASIVACGDDDSPAGDAGADAPVVDGGTCLATAADFPAPVTGRCEAMIVDPTATLPVGDDGAGGFITPGARRVTRVGVQVDLPHFPMKLVQIPGTRFVVITDGGIAIEYLTVVNLDTMMVVDQEAFRRGDLSPEALFLGLVISADGRRLWASGGGSSTIWAYDVDPATGQITPATARHITAAMSADVGYVSGLALKADGTLIANLMQGDDVVMYDGATGAEMRRIALPDDVRPYDIVLSPDESTAFVSNWSGHSVAVLDLAAGTVRTEIPVGKNPEGLAVSPDGTKLVVASSDSDSISVIDVATSAVVSTLYVHGESTPRGASPAATAFDAAGRLYVVNAGDNALDVFDPTATGFTRVGRVPTMWYPTYAHVLADGTLLILNGKHTGTGANTTPGETDILDLLGGSLQIVPAADLTPENLTAWETEVATNNDRATRFQEVVCPADAEYDFPIPQPGTGPSRAIEHVVVVVRENKTFDAYLGDLGIGNGDPTLTIVPTTETDQVFPNTRKLAREFAFGDNYYSLAEQSIQGHILTTTGRTTDMVERTWLTTWGRGYWGIPPQGIFDPFGYPEEGSLFDYLVANDVDAQNYGEIVSSRSLTPHPRFPGLVYNMEVLDADKARWLRDQWAGLCRMPTFSYVLMPNDHTYGGRPGKQTPKSMIADNDEGVGILADAISHSSYWPTTVMFVVQDDPQDGGDHVDNHRSPIQVISPWVKRGYASSVHYSEASMYRTIQLILGLPAPLNAYWANAAPMYDAFTSTPDYTPYEHVPRRWPSETNPDGTEVAAISEQYDWSMPDEQPGLSRIIWKMTRGTTPPWRHLPEWEIELEEAEGDD